LSPVGDKSLVRKRKDPLTFISSGEIPAVSFIVPLDVHLSRVTAAEGLFKECLKPPFIEGFILLCITLEEDSAEIVVTHKITGTIGTNNSTGDVR